jgi:dTDP-4-dehydrorhamnose 3,5-epimerase
MGVRFSPTALPGVLICELDMYPDARGFFSETYHRKKYEEGGIKASFVQDNFSHSLQGVLRGLHYQLLHPQAKLMAVSHGAVFDVAVDIRRSSPTFGKWVGTILSRENRRQLFIPEGFAHGFCVLSEQADLVYKCSAFYAPNDDRGVLWSDPLVQIDWPVKEPVLSEKDQSLPRLEDIPPDQLPVYEGDG